MVLNSSRLAPAMECWKKAFNLYHRNLKGPAGFPLIDGAGFHEGLAVGMSSKDWTTAHREAEKKFREMVDKAGFLEAELYTVEEHLQLVHKMIDTYKDNYEGVQYQVIQPECDFDVALPHSEHSCVWLHHWERERESGSWIEKWGPPSAEAILEKRILNHRQYFERFAHADTTPCYWGICECWQPHRLKGKTDAVVIWEFAGQRGLWLLEHKTTAISGKQFWDQWFLEIQPTIYLYGIWKATGMRPSGFILNALIKPTRQQVEGYNKRRKYGPPQSQIDYVKYEREAFIRTDEDMHRIEQQAIEWANEWEERIQNGRFPMSNVKTICHSYNRACDFYMCCVNHDAPNELEALGRREKDYIDVRMEELWNSNFKPATKLENGTNSNSPSTVENDS